MNQVEIFKYGDFISLEEDRYIEFKAVQITAKVIESVTRLSQEYVNSFLNTEGFYVF
jgi:hypothetical protein